MAELTRERLVGLREDTLPHGRYTISGETLLALVDMAELGLAAAEEVAKRRAEYEACTGMSASWCPRCGDCTCERWPDGTSDFDGRDCALHGEKSTHAVPPSEDT